jgi:hypothetical protein
MGSMKDKKLGKDVEYLIRDVFLKKGYTFELSEDDFDKEKDAVLIVNGDRLRLEIKLETRVFKFNTFTVPVTSNENYNGLYENQLSKCMNVEVLVFVQRPEPNDPKGPALRVYLAPPLGEREFVIRQNEHDGRIVAHFPIDKMTLLCEIRDSNILQKYMTKGAGQRAKSLQYS